MFAIEMGELTAASFAPDNAFMIIEGERRFTPSLIDLQGGAIVHELQGYTRCAISPVGGLVAARAGTAIVLWDVATRREVDRLDFARAGDQPSAPTWTPDGKAFVVSTEQGLILGFEITA